MASFPRSAKRVTMSGRRAPWRASGGPALFDDPGYLMRYKSTPLAARSPRPPAPSIATRTPTSPLATFVATLLMAILPLSVVIPLAIANAATASLTANPSSTAPGSSVTIVGARFSSQQRGSLVLGGTVLGTFKASRSGAFSTSVRIPSSATVGTHTLSAVASASGGRSAILASTSLAVLRPPGVSPPATPSATPRPTSTPTPTPAPSATATPAPSPTAAASAVATATAAPTPVGAAPPPTGAAMYVATNGSDANPGTLARPLASPGRAAATAPAGTTVYLRAGTYPGFEVTRSGLTFAPYPGEAVVINDPGRDDVVQFSAVTSGALRDMTVLGSQVGMGSAIKIKDSAAVNITGVTIRDSRTWGIVVVRSNGVLLENNDISRTANAIEERYASDLVIRGNRLYANTTMVDGGRGREGINFYKSTGPVSVVGNLLWDNGTHFEVYGASNLTFTDNTTWNGQVMETGTDGPACDNLRFVRNVGYRGTPLDGTANGMILRCASNSLVANNTFDGFDQFAFDIVDGTLGSAYGGSIGGLRVVNNIVVGGRAFSIDSALPSSVVIDYNLVDITGSTAQYGNYVAYMAGVGNFKTLPEFTAATGYQAHGLGGDPRFVDRAARDYRLRSDSPAIDRGVQVGDGFSGAAPDLGRFEAR